MSGNGSLGTNLGAKLKSALAAPVRKRGVLPSVVTPVSAGGTGGQAYDYDPVWITVRDFIALRPAFNQQWMGQSQVTSTGVRAITDIIAALSTPTNPITISHSDELLSGHTRQEKAKKEVALQVLDPNFKFRVMRLKPAYSKAQRAMLSINANLTNQKAQTIQKFSSPLPVSTDLLNPPFAALKATDHGQRTPKQQYVTRFLKEAKHLAERIGAILNANASGQNTPGAVDFLALLAARIPAPITGVDLYKLKGLGRGKWKSVVPSTNLNPYIDALTLVLKPFVETVVELKEPLTSLKGESIWTYLFGAQSTNFNYPLLQLAFEHRLVFGSTKPKKGQTIHVNQIKNLLLDPAVGRRIAAAVRDFQGNPTTHSTAILNALGF